MSFTSLEGSWPALSWRLVRVEFQCCGPKNRLHSEWNLRVEFAGGICDFAMQSAKLQIRRRITFRSQSPDTVTLWAAASRRISRRQTVCGRVSIVCAGEQSSGSLWSLESGLFCGKAGAIKARAAICLEPARETECGSQTSPSAKGGTMKRETSSSEPPRAVPRRQFEHFTWPQTGQRPASSAAKLGGELGGKLARCRTMQTESLSCTQWRQVLQYVTSGQRLSRLASRPLLSARAVHLKAQCCGQS